MKRRIFFSKTSATILGLGITSDSFANKTKKKIKQPIRVCTTIDKEEVSFFVETINESIKVVHMADTHLLKTMKGESLIKSLVTECQKLITKLYILKLD